MTEGQVKSALEEWLVSQTSMKDLTAIDPDLDLVTNRVVDSLKFVDLVLLVEELSGRAIAMESVDLRQFTSINAIWTAFFT